MAVQSYPQEVWDRLKEVYETSPKLTWQQLVDFVAEELGCEMPSASVVRRKALAEKWKKRTKSLVKKSAQQLNKEIKKMTSQKTGQKSSQADDSKDKNSNLEYIQPNWQDFVKNDKLKELIKLAIENNRDLKIAILNIFSK